VKPLTIKVHAIAKDQLFVRSNRPRLDLELKADVTYTLVGAESYAEGSVDVIRGLVEIIGGRSFEVQRGRVQFTGGPPTAALLDVQALYDNPAAEVTVVVTGPMLEPEIRLTSQPPMDEAEIAMLIATGRTELEAGAGGVGTITGEEAGKAAASALATQVFKNLVADKLPLDTVALDAGALRAGKYMTEKIYVGYVRRFENDPEKDENVDEVRVEYRISPRWTFESRYGSAQAGGASLVWSKDY
jgi:translocation and assembly module TamB